MAIYVKDRAGHIHIATQQMIGRIQSGELTVCDAPTKDTVRPDNTFENRKRAAEATMIEAIPKDIKMATAAPSAEAVAAIAAQLVAEGDPLAQSRAPAVLTAAQVEAEAKRIIAEDAQADLELQEAIATRKAIEAAQAAGKVYETAEVKAAREQLEREQAEATKAQKIAEQEAYEARAAAARLAAAQQHAVPAGFPTGVGFPSVAAAGAGFPKGVPDLTFNPE